MSEPIDYRLPDGTRWPRPGNLEWELRYASAERVEKVSRYHAAWCVSAYAELLRMPERKRREVIRMIRAAEGKSDGN